MKISVYTKYIPETNSITVESPTCSFGEICNIQNVVFQVDVTALFMKCA